MDRKIMYQYRKTFFTLSMIIILMLTGCGLPTNQNAVHTAVAETVAAQVTATLPACTTDLNKAVTIISSLNEQQLKAWLAQCEGLVNNQPTQTPTPNGTPFIVVTKTGESSVSVNQDDSVKAITSCGAELVTQPYTSKYFDNADDGNGSVYTLWLAGQGFTNTSNYQMSLLPPGASLDLEGVHEILSYGVKITGTIEEADCAAKAIVKVMKVTAYLYSPATTQLGSEWHNTISPDWEGKAWEYTEEKIETGGTWSDDMTLDYTNHTLCAPENGYANAQLWDPNAVMPAGHEAEPKPAYHPAIDGTNGIYCLTTPVMQGTWWSITGDFNYNLLVDRWFQTQREVDLRDEHPQLFVFWCGDPENVPVGFTTELPAGFACNKQ